MGRVGRPRKEYEVGSRPTILSISVPEGIAAMIPANVNLSREVTAFLELKYGGKGKLEAELESIREKIRRLEEDLQVARETERLILERIRQRDEQRKQQLFELNAVAHYLSNMIMNMAKETPLCTEEMISEAVANLKERAGIIIKKTAMKDAINLAYQNGILPQGADLISYTGVTFTPNFREKYAWKLIMESYEDYLRGLEEKEEKKSGEG